MKVGYIKDAGFVYTVASGRLFKPIAAFHAQAEVLMGRPILTHEFASKQIWTDMREALEAELEKTFNE